MKITDPFVWPSDAARAENDELNRVCEKLEEMYDEREDLVDTLLGVEMVLVPGSPLRRIISEKIQKVVEPYRGD